MNSKVLLFCALVALPFPCAAAQFKLLHTFGGAGDGAQPSGSLALDAKGNIYGITQSDDANGFGRIYVRHPNGTEAVLHTFDATHDGSFPASGLSADQTGLLYGTNVNGGAHNGGTVFRITPKGKLTVLHAFRGGRKEGDNPLGTLILDNTGAIYGTASRFGSKVDGGTVFKLTQDGTESTLHAFNVDSTDPQMGVIAGSDGNFYGATRFGGSVGAGSVFRLAPDGTFKVLHNFTGVPDNDGADPLGGLVFGPDGKLYGTTAVAGVNKGGVLFRLSTNGSNYEIVHAFKGSGGGGANDGQTPLGNLAVDSAGNIFGTTQEGGANTTAGTVFEYTAAGQYRVVHSFAAATEGAAPDSGVTVGPDNTLYGTASGGGANNRGTLFSIKLTN